MGQLGNANSQAPHRRRPERTIPKASHANPNARKSVHRDRTPLKAPKLGSNLLRRNHSTGKTSLKQYPRLGSCTTWRGSRSRRNLQLQNHTLDISGVRYGTSERQVAVTRADPQISEFELSSSSILSVKSHRL